MSTEGECKPNTQGRLKHPYCRCWVAPSWGELWVISTLAQIRIQQQESYSLYLFDGRWYQDFCAMNAAYADVLYWVREWRKTLYVKGEL